jgi:hypothetical protein
MKAIQQLQLEVLTKFGVTPLQPSDCKDLSNIIREGTGKIVSETTIKRFFGFAAQTFNFSVYTLNALSEYAGFNNWEFFLEHYRQQQSPQMEFHPKWQEIKSKTGKITFYTTEAIKNNCGVDFGKTATRADTLPLQHFLDTDSVASVLLAPSGYGKSVALAQIVESFWLKESCLYPNDVCLFVHLHHLNTLINRGFSMEDWLDNQLNLGDGENIIDYFEQHASEKGGKFVLIVDGFDDKVIASEKLKILYSKLMELIFSRAHTPWLKVIMAARPEAWSLLTHAMDRQGSYSTHPESSAADIVHESTQEYTLPLLSALEVTSVLKMHGVPESTTSTMGESLVQLLAFPPFLQLACSMNDSKGSGLIHDTGLTYRIIGQYARTKVMSNQDSGLKMAILRKILDDSHNLKMKLPASQVRVFSGDPRVQEAYRRLLSDRILQEDHQEGKRSLPIKRVRFANEQLAQFFIATFSVSSTADPIDHRIYSNVLSEFSHLPEQTGILQWILLFLIDQRSFDVIGELFSEITQLSQKAALFEFLLVQPSKEERLTGIMRDILLDKDFKTYFLRNHLLYEVQGTRKNYLKQPLEALLVDEEDQVSVACLFFMAALYQLDGDLLAAQIPVLGKSMQPFNRTGTALHPAELCLFIHQCLTEQKVDPITLEKIQQFEDYLVLSDHTILSLKDEMTAFLLTYTALVLKEYKLLERLVDYVFAEIPSLKMRSHDPFRLIALLIKSRYYLYEGDQPQYNRCLNHVETVMQSGSPVLGQDVVSIYLDQVKAISHFRDGEYDKVLECIQRAQAIVKRIHFVLFDHWCYQMQAAAFQNLRKQKLSQLAEGEAERIREQCPFSILPPFDLNGFAADLFGKRAINH